MAWIATCKSDKENNELLFMIVHVPLFHTSVFYNTRTKYVYLKRANWVDRLYAYWVMGLQVFSSSCIYILSKMNMCLEAIPYHQSEQLRAWSYYTPGRNAWHDFVPNSRGYPSAH